MKKILVVEDDSFISDIASIKLSDHGYEVVIASDGESARAKIASSDFTAVLLDINLPDISGVDLLAEIRNSERHQKLPIIIFSNENNEVEKSLVKEMGISGYFIKASTNYDELFNCIDDL